MRKNLDLISEDENTFERLEESVRVKTFSPKILEEETCLTLLGENGNRKAYIQFYYNVDGFGSQFSFLDYAESYEPGEGNFSILFREFESIVREQSLEYILLMVDYDNDNAISVYQHLGFYSLGYIDTVSENMDQIYMRKDLFDSE